MGEPRDNPAGDTPRGSGEARTDTLRARHRVSHDTDYKRIYDAQVRKHDGPLTVFALPNELGHPRLGLSISKRKLGSAVRRNRVKRRLREAFRVLDKDELGAFDYLVVTRAHQPLKVESYRVSLERLTRRLRTTWAKRGEPDV